MPPDDPSDPPSPQLVPLAKYNYRNIPTGPVLQQLSLSRVNTLFINNISFEENLWQIVRMSKCRPMRTTHFYSNSNAYVKLIADI